MNTFRLSYAMNIDQAEISNFFELVFTEIDDESEFSAEQNQVLSEWFSVEEMLRYLEHGKFIEARTNEHELVGAVFIAKQNPVTWPDGQKMEIFILGVHPNYQGQGIARQLIHAAEEYAHNAGAKKIVVNTHIAMTSVHTMYEKLGYKNVGTLLHYYENGDAVFFQKEV